MAARSVVARIVLAASTAAATCAAQSAADSVSTRTQIHTDSGVIEGVQFGDLATELMFLEIPYAAAPTGVRRWTAP